MAFDRIGIIGTGLMGASVGLAVKATKPNSRILGFDATGGNARDAQRVKAIDKAASLTETVRESDLVVVATPVGAMKSLFQEVAPLLKAGAVVTDVGSTKARVLEWAQEFLPTGTQFIGGHPMAGRTETGADAADAKLFQGTVWCVTPSPAATRESIDRLLKLIEDIGATPYFLDAEEHDGLAAAVSHLPYLQSVALISQVGSERSWRESASVAATGFAYATHLTDSDPQMWTDVVRTNRANVVRRIDGLIRELEILRDAIERDEPGVKEHFERARALHQDWLAGRAQGTAGEKGSEMPNTRSMITGGLFGRWGEKKEADKEAR